MKKRLTATLTALIMTFSLVSCGQSESSSSESKAETANTSVTTKAETKPKQKNDHELTQDEIMKKYGYKGKFDDKIFEKMVNSIYVNDLHLAFPCTLKDLVKMDDTFHIRYGALYYKDYEVGMLELENYDNIHLSEYYDRDKLIDNKITGITLTWLGKSSAKRDNSYLSISFGGIHIWDDNIATVKKYLGEPTQKHIKYKANSHSGGRIDYITYVTDKVELCINFDTSNRVARISYSNK